MLLEFSCANHKSIREEIVFSALAGSDTTYEEKTQQGNVDSITVKVIYDGFEIDLMQEESTGVKKLFSLFCPLLDIIMNGKVLLCDELEAGLGETPVDIKMHLQKQRPKNFKGHSIG